ncbi:MAG: hypothetical protein JWM19_5115 [Actinomycetia bacterium]|nr:hypothetical protein [Actinomycetes bacterium]
MNVLNVVLRGALCEACNSGWLGGQLERQVAPLLAPMAVQRKSAVLDAAPQTRSGSMSAAVAAVQITALIA